MADCSCEGKCPNCECRHKLVEEITKVVRQADQSFETNGGSSRHWVRDEFLPRLYAAGFRIVKDDGTVIYPATRAVPKSTSIADGRET